MAAAPPGKPPGATEDDYDFLAGKPTTPSSRVTIKQRPARVPPVLPSNLPDGPTDFVAGPPGDATATPTALSTPTGPGVRAQQVQQSPGGATEDDYAFLEGKTTAPGQPVAPGFQPQPASPSLLPAQPPQPGVPYRPQSNARLLQRQLDLGRITVEQEEQNLKLFRAKIQAHQATNEEIAAYNQRLGEQKQRVAEWQGLNAQYQHLPASTVPAIAPVQYHPPPEEARLAEIEPVFRQRQGPPFSLVAQARTRQAYGVAQTGLAHTFPARLQQLKAAKAKIEADEKQLTDLAGQAKNGQLSPATIPALQRALRQHQMNALAYAGALEDYNDQVQGFQKYLEKNKNQDPHLGMIYPEEVGDVSQPGAAERAYQLSHRIFQPIAAAAEKNVPIIRRGMMLAGAYPPLPELPANLPPQERQALIRQKNDLVAVVQRDFNPTGLELDPLTGRMVPARSHLAVAALTPFQRSILPVVQKQVAAENKAREIAGVEKGAVIDAAATAAMFLVGPPAGAWVGAKLAAKFGPLLFRGLEAPVLVSNTELLGRLLAGRVLPEVGAHVASFTAGGAAGSFVAGTALGPPRKPGQAPPTVGERLAYGAETAGKSVIPSAVTGIAWGLGASIFGTILPVFIKSRWDPATGPQVNEAFTAEARARASAAGVDLSEAESGRFAQRFEQIQRAPQIAKPALWRSLVRDWNRFMKQGRLPVTEAGPVPPPEGGIETGRLGPAPAQLPGGPSFFEGQPPPGPTVTTPLGVSYDLRTRPVEDVQQLRDQFSQGQAAGTLTPVQQADYARVQRWLDGYAGYQAQQHTVPVSLEAHAAIQTALTTDAARYGIPPLERAITAAEAKGDTGLSRVLQTAVQDQQQVVGQMINASFAPPDHPLAAGPLSPLGASAYRQLTPTQRAALPAGALQTLLLQDLTNSAHVIDPGSLPLFRIPPNIRTQQDLTALADNYYGVASGHLALLFPSVQQQAAPAAAPLQGQPTPGGAPSGQQPLPTTTPTSPTGAAVPPTGTTPGLAGPTSPITGTTAPPVGTGPLPSGGPGQPPTGGPGTIAPPPPVTGPQPPAPSSAPPTGTLPPVSAGNYPPPSPDTLPGARFRDPATNTEYELTRNLGSVWEATVTFAPPGSALSVGQVVKIAAGKLLNWDYLGNPREGHLAPSGQRPTEPPSGEVTPGPPGEVTPGPGEVTPGPPGKPHPFSVPPEERGPSEHPVTPENLQPGARVRSVGTGIEYDLKKKTGDKWDVLVTAKPPRTRAPVNVGDTLTVPESALLKPGLYDYLGNPEAEARGEAPPPEVPPVEAAPEEQPPVEAAPEEQPPPTEAGPVAAPPEAAPEEQAPTTTAPPAKQQPEPAPAAAGELAQPVYNLIEALTAHIDAAMNADEPIFKNNRGLEAFAQQHLGGSRAAGTYDAQTVYNALEAAVNQYIVGQELGRQDPEMALEHLRDLQTALPTQTIRAGDKDALQQFSTPPTIAFTAARALALQPGENLLEPSAGTGSLLAMAQSVGEGPHEYAANEIDPERRAILAQFFTPDVYDVDARYLNSTLPHELSFDTILMNPPFSAAAGQRAVNTNTVGFQHVEEALSRLRPGGRLVAILGRGASFEHSTAAPFWNRVREKYTVQANVPLPGKEYQKYGTTFATQLVVIDNTGPTVAPPWTGARMGPGNVAERAETLEEVLEGLNEQGFLVRAAASGVGAAPHEPVGGGGGRAGPVAPGPGPGVRDRQPGERGGLAVPPGVGGAGEAVPGGVPEPHPAGGGEAPGQRGGTAPAGPVREPRPGVAGPGVQPDRQLDLAWMFRQGGLLRNRETGEQFKVTEPYAPGNVYVAAEGPHGEEVDISTGEDPSLRTKYQVGDFDLVRPGPLYPEEVKPGALLIHPTVGDVVRVISLRKLAKPLVDKAEIEYVQVPHPDGIQQGDRALVPADTLLSDYLPYRPEPGALLEQEGGGGPAPRPRPSRGGGQAPKAAAPEPTPPEPGDVTKPTLPAEPKPKKEATPPPPAGAPSEERQDIGAQYSTTFPLHVLEGRPHPAVMVESRSLAAVDPPPVTVTHAVKAEALYPTQALAERYAKATGQPVPDPKNLGVSNLQIEPLLYAIQRWGTELPDGSRAGFLLGDAMGAGKGRTIALMIAHLHELGVRRFLWLSAQAGLLDATRADLAAIGYEHIPLKSINAYPGGEYLPAFEGVLFSTYNSLINPAKQGTLKDQPRREQLERWLVGGTADNPEGDRGENSLIIFDESHAMKGFSPPAAGGRQQRPPSGTGIEGVKLQQNLPRARVVYSSGTPMAELDNMGYLVRLGLWGPGTAWPAGFLDFRREMADSDKMELVARDMKARGMFLSREQTYQDPENRPQQSVEFRTLTHPLSEEQERQYGRVAAAWQVVLANIEAALTITGNSRQARMNAMNAFWSGHQRFFRQFLTALKLPSLFEDIDKELAAKRSVIVSLIGTGETALKKAVTAAAAAEEGLDNMDLTPIAGLMALVERAFPTALWRDTLIPGTNKTVSEIAKDADGNVIHNPDAIRLKEQMLAQLAGITERLPGNPIDAILFRYGHNNVSELTAREKRLEPGPDGKLVYVNRGGSKVNGAEMDRFNRGDTRVAILSKSANMGISMQAGRQFKNQQRRTHYMLELSWSADATMQGNGRSHRTNQVSAPTYVIVSTNAGGENRFAATTARRLASLGALSHAERTATGSAEGLAQFDYENDYGKSALDRLYQHILMGGQIPGLANPQQALRDMGVLRESQDGRESVADEKRRHIPHFMNRLLALPIAEQNPLFNAFDAEMRATIQRAKDEGRYDFGVQDIRGENLREAAPPQVVATDPATGATTVHHNILSDEPSHPITLEELDDLPEPWKLGFFRRNKDQKLVYMAAAGSPIEPNRVITPSNWHHSLISDADRDRNFTRIPDAQQLAARTAWQTEVDAVPKFHTRRYHLITGAILHLYDRLKSTGIAHFDVRRAKLAEGPRVVGLSLPRGHDRNILKALGATAAALNPAEIYQEVLSGDDVQLVSGLSLKPGTISGTPVAMIHGLDWDMRKDLENQGFPSERIGTSYNFHTWIPTDPVQGPALLARLLERFPPLDAGPAAPAGPVAPALPSTRRRGVRVIPPVQVPISIPGGWPVPFPTLRWLEGYGGPLSVLFQELARDALTETEAAGAHDFGVLLWPEVTMPGEKGNFFLGGMSAPVFASGGEPVGRAVYVNPFPPLYEKVKDTRGSEGRQARIYQGLKESSDPDYVADEILTSMIHELAHQRVEDEGAQFIEAMDQIEGTLGPERVEELKDGIKRLIAGVDGKLLPEYLAARREYYAKARADRRPAPAFGDEGAPGGRPALGQAVGSRGPPEPGHPGKAGRGTETVGQRALKATARTVEQEAQQLEALDFDWAQEGAAVRRRTAAELRRLARPVPAGAGAALVDEIDRLQRATGESYAEAAAHDAAKKGLQPADYTAYTARAEEIRKRATAARAALKSAWEKIGVPLRTQTPPTSAKDQFLKEVAAAPARWQPALGPEFEEHTGKVTANAYTGRWTDVDDTPTVQRNLARVAGAITGHPLDLVGFRHESPGGRMPGTGVYYAISPHTSRGYAPRKTAATPLGKVVGPLASFTVDALAFDNPLVVNGGHYGVIQVLDTLPFTPGDKQAIEYPWKEIHHSFDDKWYAVMDKAIAQAAVRAGFDALLYRKTDLGRTRDFISGKSYWDQRRNESVIVDLRGVPVTGKPKGEKPQILFQATGPGPPAPQGPREGPGHRTEPAELPDAGLQAQLTGAEKEPEPDPQGLARFWQNVREWPKLFMRDYPELPHGVPAYSELHYRALDVEKAWSYANMNAVLALKQIYDDMNPHDESFFRLVVLVSDLAEEVATQTARIAKRLGGKAPWDQIEPLIQLPEGDGTPEQKWTPARVADMFRWVQTELGKPENATAAEAVQMRRMVVDQIMSRLSAAQIALTGSAPELTRREWYHHMINDFAEQDRNARLGPAGGKGGHLRPAKAPYLLRREGSLLNYNTNLLAVELTWMPGAIYNAHLYEFEAWTRDRYDIRKELQKLAIEINDDRVMPILDAMAAEINKKRTRGEPITGEDLYSRMNAPIARGFFTLGWLAHENPEWLPGHDDPRWEDLIEAIGTNHDLRLHQASAGSEPAELDSELARRVFPYLQWLLTPPQAGQAGSGAAARIFKGIREKKLKIKALLGPRHVTWKHLLHSEFTLGGKEIDFTDHTAYLPDHMNPNVFYFAWTMRDRIANALLEAEEKGIGLTLNLTGADLRRVRAVGGRRPEWAIPKVVADTLNRLNNPYRVVTPISEAIGFLGSTWKASVLFNPMHFIPWQIRNMASDVEMLTFNPDSRRYVLPAATMLWDFLAKGQSPADDLREWLDWGGHAATLTATSLGAVSGALRPLEHLRKQRESLSDRTIGALFRALRVGAEGREAILRFANYLSYRDHMLAHNGEPQNYGASNPRDINAIGDPRFKAWILSNELLGAYDRTPPGFKIVRQYLPAPFSVWKIVNDRRMINLWNNNVFEPLAEWMVMEMPLALPSNTMRQLPPHGSTPGGGGSVPPGGGGGPAGPSAEEEDAARRKRLREWLGLRAEAKRSGVNWRWVAARIGWKTPFVLYWAARLLFKLHFFNALTVAHNWAFHREEEEALPPWVRYRAHVDLGHMGTSKLFAYIDRTSGVGDAEGFFGLDDLPGYINQYRAGRISGIEMLADMLLRDPAQEIFDQVGGPLKLLYELASRTKAFPNFMEPRPIKDRWQHLFDQISMGRVYNAYLANRFRGRPVLMGKLDPLTRAAGITYFNPLESPYDEMRETAINWQKERQFGREMGPPSDRDLSQMAYWAKRAMAVGDDAAVRQYLVQFWQLGGNNDKFSASLQRTYPLYGWPQNQRDEFLASLKGGEIDRWRNGLWFLQQTYAPELKFGKVEMKAHQHQPIAEFDEWLWGQVSAQIDAQDRFGGFETSHPEALPLRRKALAAQGKEE